MDAIDLAQQENMQFLSVCLQSKQRNEKISDFQRIDENGNIICKRCKRQIPKKRLLAVPNAIYCVECQEKADKNRQQYSIYEDDDEFDFEGN